MRLERALCALEGLSLGDAFGEQFFENQHLTIGNRLPPAPWRFTDDTQMALSIAENLRQFGEIRQEELAISFARHYDPTRGYGPAMHRLLSEIASGRPWQEAAASQFAGQGSYGNGSAMRAAPIGAYFADDLNRVVENASRSSEVTHSHPEAIAGAIAVAIAAAIAWQMKLTNTRPGRSAFIEAVLPYVPASVVREKLCQARDLPAGSPVPLAAATLGNGKLLSAQDTVPFTLWCAGEYLDNYETALWETVSAFGDRDTTCAIVGGIVALHLGQEALPEIWRAAREPLPAWPFKEVPK
jgi:ADP-ribosylglycohydrolase